MIPGVRLVMLGKQGAGKGTQAIKLAAHYVVPHISTGDIFRAAVREQTEMGRRLAEFMEAGELVPDEVTIGVVAERLEQPDASSRGFVLDGFPRNTHQAEQLSKLLAPDDIDLCVDLEIPTEVALRRLAGRRVCTQCGSTYSVDAPPESDWTCDRCGGEVVQRKDDTEAAIARRLAIYEAETEPLIAFYLERDRLVTVDGVGPAEEVTTRLVRAIDRRTARRG